MSNTKWRKLLSMVGDFYSTFDVAYVWTESFQFAQSPSEKLLKEAYIEDPGIAGGPAKYADIYAMRFKRFHDVRNPSSGRISKDESICKSFIAALTGLGQYPIEEDTDFVYIYGYKK